MDAPEPALRARTFDALLDRPALDRAYRTARIILLEPADAEDATHDAALSAWRRFGELRDPARFEAWFGRILVNACRDRLRTRRRLPVPIDVIPVHALRGGIAPDPADEVATSDAIRAALRGLRPEHRPERSALAGHDPRWRTDLGGGQPGRRLTRAGGGANGRAGQRAIGSGR